MTNLKVTLTGTTPLIMNSCRLVNPLHPLKRLLSTYTTKPSRSKTDEDYAIISDLEWLAGLYFNENLSTDDYLSANPDVNQCIYIPAENIEKAIYEGATANKKGKDTKRFVSVVELEPRLITRENKTIPELWKDIRYRHVNSMRVNKARIIRTRPRFDTWGVDFTLRFDEANIDAESVAMAIERAGTHVGLCDSRPRYGQFMAAIEEI